MKKLIAVAGALVVAGAVALWAQVKGADPGKVTVPATKTILGNRSYWRQMYVLMGPVVKKGEGVEKVKLMSGGKETGQWLGMDTVLPAAAWRDADFNDASWNWKQMTNPDSPWIGLICIRGLFSVDDPEKVKELKLALTYRGGVAVYLNGKEIKRGSLKVNAGPKDLADDYAAEDLKKARQLEIAISGTQVRKGVNVLAIEVHRSAFPESAVKLVGQDTAFDSGTCGVVDVLLTAGGDDGVGGAISMRPAGYQVWNNSVMNVDFDADYGSPYERLKPIRIVTTRNGVGSGKVVVGSQKAIKNLKGVVGDLTQKGGTGVIAGGTVQVRYAEVSLGGGADYFGGSSTGRFDKLEEVAPNEIAASVPFLSSLPWGERVALQGAVVPVWVTVKAPADAQPGEYAGKLTITAEGEKPVEVPVEVKVCTWKIPDPKEWVTFADMMESPESVAMAYNVPLWGDEHFKLLAKSLTLLEEIGNNTCYIPLICDTNMGNDESMVRWIKQADGTYKYDFSVMEKYLDAVGKYQGKPMVVCFYVWDTYLEGGLSSAGLQGSLVVEDVVKARKAVEGQGPIVSIMDPATGKVEKGVLPMYSNPASEKLWAPVMSGVRERMKKRGLDSAMQLGYVTDELPSKEVAQLFVKLAPGVPWVRSTHDPYKEKAGDLPLGYTNEPYVWGSRFFGEDPSVSRDHGWAEKVLQAQFPRNLYDNFPMTQWRFMGEINASGKLRGFARLGGDFLTALKNSKGQAVGTLSARFPKSWWRMLNVQTALLAQGKKEPVSTARFEVLREGLEECEARIFIDKALVDEVKRAKLGPELAQKCQDVLDGRFRNMRRALSTLRGYDMMGRLSPALPYYEGWYFQAAILGSVWYASSDWQSESEKVYEAAAEVEAKLGGK